jgi:hypothetical protein
VSYCRKLYNNAYSFIAAANSLWNSLLEPVGNKAYTIVEAPLARVLCPIPEHPFIYTAANSIARWDTDLVLHSHNETTTKHIHRLYVCYCACYECYVGWTVSQREDANIATHRQRPSPSDTHTSTHETAQKHISIAVSAPQELEHLVMAIYT